MKPILLFILLLSISNFSYSQKAKNGNYTVTGAGTVLNAYTHVTADISANPTSITVNNNALMNAYFTTALAPGDLILIIQMQGVDLNISTYAAVAWGANYTISNEAAVAGNDNAFRPEWGRVTDYKNAGRYEYAEVLSVSGTNGITLRCAVRNNYNASAHVQVVRVPRLGNLTLNPNTSIVPTAWDGFSGGIVALETNGTVTFGANSRINASGFGFRGGVVDNTTGGPASSATQIGKPGYSAATEGAEKGEGIGGAATATGELTTVWYSRYGIGAAANGGGGGNYKNAGGGGGSNVGTGNYYGYGVPNPTYAAIWNLEQAGMSATPSSGGGRGGYSGAQSNQNVTTTPPNNAAWQGDYRRTEGGFGGHALVYDPARVYMGGGGGAGEMDLSQGGSGGRGGGIVFLQSYGTITGTGTIEANGANGENSNPSNQTPTYSVFAPTAGKKGVDGAGGAGGGGAIIVSNGTAIPNTITLSANGGNGGNNAISFHASHSGLEADGPGGGGGGGMIAFTSGTPVQSVTGGVNGIVTTGTYPTTNMMAGFPPNGATSGASGIGSLPQNYFNLIPNNASVCTGNTATLSVTVQGTLPVPNASVTWYTSYTGNTSVGTGLTFTTPVVTATTTYYVGWCVPGSSQNMPFRVPVTVTVGGPTISGTATVNNATCSSGGSITGLTTTGGAPTVTIDWNGVTSPTMNLSNASAGTYTVTVTDGIGCTATSGPYVIGSAGGPSINTTNMVVTNASCTNGDGSITGITATGTGLTYSWNGGAYTTLNISNLNAGSYNLTVTDNVGCTASSGTITVGQAAGPVINATNIVVAATTCGLNNGAISGITATGTGLSYQWNGVAGTLDQSNLASGNYNLLVTDNNGCTASHGPVVIGTSSGPVVNSAAVTITDAHCSQSNGAISGLTVSGGQTPYTYSWSPGGYSSLNLAAVPAGSYTLTVTDNATCTTNAGPFVVNDIAGPNINTTNVVITNETCAGNDGSITGITATGSGTLTYTWNFAVSPTLNHTNIPGGTYGLAVTDAFNCVATAGPFNVGTTPGPAINVTNMVVNHTTCGASNGSITGITATGTGLTYSWNGVVSTLDQTGLTAGTYTLVVTDANNCTATHGPITINGSSLPPVINTANVQITHETCAGNDGAITGLSVPGTGLIYTWNGVVTPTLNQTNIAPGTYNLVVTDAAGCSSNAGPFVVNAAVPMSLNQASLVITQTGCVGNTGAITGLQVVGGVNPTISWSNGPTTINNTNLGAGNYTITVTDDQNCSIQETFTVTSVSGLTLNTNNVVVTNDNCGVGSGSIAGITVSGGTLPYSYAWNSSPVQNTLNASNLTTGNYTLTVVDNAGCQATTTVFVGIVPPSTIDQTNVVIVDESCVGHNGAISGIQVTGNGPFTYSWSGSPLTTLNLTNLTAGTYTLTISDANGCLTTGPALTVGSFPSPNADFTISNPLASPGEVIVFTDASSGGPFISYSWTLVGTGLLGTGSSVSYSSAVEGDYDMTLIVETIDGCIDSITKPFQIFGELKIPNIVTANGDHTNDEFYITNLKPNTKLYIQNRWGNTVFQTENYKNDWGGKDLSGEKLADGVYFYQLITVDGKMWQGNVHLLID